MTDSPEPGNGPFSITAAGRFWRRLQQLRPAPIATAEALRTFLDQRAAFIAQKCAIDYCRGKTGLASYALFTEPPFIKALEVCRWESFVAVLGDLHIMAEGYLRPYATADQRSRLCTALLGLYSAVLGPLAPPVHRSHGWDEVIASFTARFEAASAGKPQRALDVADHSARRLFETLPIHASMRMLDEEVVYGAVRFRMIAVSQEMHRRLRAVDLVKQLLENPGS